MTEDPIDSGGKATIVRLAEMPPMRYFARQLDEIFFTSSATKSFAGEEERSAFRERWLGRYLEDDPDWFYVALVGDRLAGYLAGSIDDPARTARFSDIGYFEELAGWTGQYPAHLHINVGAAFRGGGVGSRLIDRFASDLRIAGVEGVHLVTGRHSRNIPFYLRNGFTPLKVIKGDPSDSIMLGRLLD